ncbi:MAG: TlpA disulfide reductase family protein [Flavobacteriaceae bacterium]|nr:TlpA disulfide reductase family protein [Flavobacteriaceae bacterium]
MKKILFITLLFSSFSIFSQSYTISGQISNAENKTIYLLNSAKVEIDSTLIRNNSFTFKGKLSEPNVHYLKVKDFKSISTILLDNSHINLIADAENMRSAKISGSKLMEENSAFREGLQDYYDMLNDSFDKAMEAMNNNDSINSVKYENQNVYYSKLINDSTESYISKNPNSFISLLQLKDKIEVFPLNISKKLFENFSNELKNHTIGKDIHYRLYVFPNTVNIGNLAPEIEGFNVNNKLIKLSDFKGKYVLLDFWASWCAPCRKEIPLLKKLYKKYNQKGFEILSYSLDTKNEDLIKALKKENFQWQNVSDLKGFEGKIAKKYNITFIPRNFIISPEGKILEINKHDEELKNLLIDIFNE